MRKAKREKLGGGDHPDVVEPGHLAGQPAGEVDLLVELAAEGADAVELERQPDPEAPVGLRELGAVDVEVDQVRVLLLGGHVVASEGVGAAQGLAVAHQERAGAVGQEEPLVGIEDQRVGELEAGEGFPAAFGQAEEGPVGAVHVQPEPLLPGEAGELGQGVDGAGVDRAGVAHHQEGGEAAAAVLGHRLGQGVEADAEGPVRRHLAGVRRREAREGRGLGQRVVGLVGEVEGAREERLGEPVAAGGHEGRQVGHGAAARQEPPGLRRKAHEPGEPGEDVRLELHQGRGGGEDAGVAVDRVADQVGQGAGEEAAPGDEAQVARARGVERPGRGALEEELQELGEGAALLGRRLDQRAGELDGALDVRRRLVGQALDVGDDPFHRLVDEAAHLYAGGFEGPGALGFGRHRGSVGVRGPARAGWRRVAAPGPRARGFPARAGPSGGMCAPPAGRSRG